MNSTLCEYSNTDSTSPDGIMGETILQIAAIYDELKIPFFDFRRFLNLGWDSHKIKDRLGAYC